MTLIVNEDSDIRKRIVSAEYRKKLAINKAKLEELKQLFTADEIAAAENGTQNEYSQKLSLLLAERQAIINDAPSPEDLIIPVNIVRP